MNRRLIAISVLMVLVGAGLLGANALAVGQGPLTGVTSMGVGGGHAVAITTTANLWGWGYNDHGQTGVGRAGNPVLTPTEVSSVNHVTAATGSDEQTWLLTSDGKVLGFGDPKNLGVGTSITNDALKPVQVPLGARAKSIAGDGGRNGNQGYAVLQDGTARAWGFNDSGQLGDGTTTTRSSPVRVLGLSNVTRLEGGLAHALALTQHTAKSPAVVYAWGDNSYGQLGTGDRTSHRIPVRVTGLGGEPTQIAAGHGGDYSMALVGGTVLVWGHNDKGQLGSGTVGAPAGFPAGAACQCRPKPMPIPGLSNVIQIAAGGGTGMALKADHTVWVWGDDAYGQLGNGKVGSSLNTGTPVQVKGLNNVKAIAAGGGFMLALNLNNQVVAWGINEHGELGAGNEVTQYATPGVVGVTRTLPGGGFPLLGALGWMLFVGVLVLLIIDRATRRPAVQFSPATFQAAPLPVYVPPEGAGRTAPDLPEAPSELRELDAGWRAHGRRVRLLGRVDLFDGVSDPVLEDVAASMKPRAVAGGEVVCREGEVSDELLLVESGTLATTAEIGGQPREIARLGPGEFFGELAVLGDGRRSATVQAVTTAQLWTLTGSDLRQLITRHPEIEAAVQRVTGQRDRSASGVRNASGVFEVEQRELSELEQDGRRIGIGRALDNQVVIASPVVSRHHAVIEQIGDRFRLRDLDSQNGTYVNGAPVRSADLDDGDEIWVGDERIIFDRRAIHRLVEAPGIRLDALNLSRELPNGRKLIDDISLTVLAGEFVAIVGGSGAGKTTLMDAMSGVRSATSGRVLYNGRDYYRNLSVFRSVLGYVPQDDIIHTDLPLRLTLHHSARLRLPPDTSPEELDAAVDKALAELELTAQADTRVGQLSGGQRKRSSMGVELLTEPRIFFLDEPTSGLDPLTDGQMMRLLRRLADQGSTVMVTTHATKNVMLCDKVVFLAPGGHLAFVGSPQRALRYFEADAFDEIYLRLAEEVTPEEWAQRFRASDDYKRLVGDQLQPHPTDVDADERQSLGDTLVSGGPLRQLRQFAVLSRRSFDRFKHNPKVLPSLVMPPILFTVLALFLFHSGQVDKRDSVGTLQILFLIAFSSFIFGLLFAVQELVSEFPIFRRERMVNLGIFPYVMSKTTFLAPLLVVMLIVMVVILRLTGRLPHSGLGVYAQIMLTLVLVGLVGLALALLTSAFVSTSQQATDMLSVWIMPQVLFGGALVAVHNMNVVGKVISAVAPVRWSFEALGHIVNLHHIFDTDPNSRVGVGLGIVYTNTFDHSPAPNWVILALFIVVPIALTCWVLKRKTSKA